jgi:hypothetical protein
MIYYIFLPLGIILIFLSVFLLYKAWNVQKEGFQSSTQDELETVYKSLTGIVCPALLKLRQKFADNPNNGNVDDYIYNMAGGDVIYCPALLKERLYMMDPNIGEQMVRTIVFLEKTMSNIIADINNALSKACMKEEFEDVIPEAVAVEPILEAIPEPALEPTPEEKAKAEAEAKEKAKILAEAQILGEAPSIKVAAAVPDITSNISDETKELIYGQRLSSLKAAIEAGPDILNKLKIIQYLYLQITDIEKNPENLKGTC